MLCVVPFTYTVFLKVPNLTKSLQLFCYSGITNRGDFTSVFSAVLFLRHGFSQAVF